MYAIPYLVQQFFYRILEFFEHWYYRSFIRIGGWAVRFLEFLDKIFALKITVRHFGEPLFQDYSVIGYTMGFVFRTLRIILGSAIYLAAVLFFAALYGAWAMIPIYIVVFKILYV